MNRHLRVIGSILRKDTLLLWPLVAMAMAAVLLQALYKNFDPQSTSSVLTALLPVAVQLMCAVLVFAVIHQDAVASIRHDWLTRPIPRLDLVAAKAIFIAIVILLPLVAGDFIAGLRQGYSGGEAFLEAIALREDLFVALLGIAAIASLTSTVVEAIGAVIGVFILALLIFPISSRMSGMQEEVLFLGSGWIFTQLLLLAVLAVSLVVLWLQYGYRKSGLARAIFAAAVAVLLIAPAFARWHAAFAIQQALSPDPAAAKPFDLALPDGCFQSMVLDSMRNDSSAARDMSAAALAGATLSPNLWGAEQRRDAGAGAIAFTTTVAPTGIAQNWKVMMGRVQAAYVNDLGVTVHRMWPARFTPSWQPAADGTMTANHFWLLPRTEYERLQSQSARLRLDYSLSLLRPQASFELAVGGKRQYLQGLGYCGATLEQFAYGPAVKIDCFKHGTQSALLVAKFADASDTTAVPSGYPDYTPALFQLLGGERRVILLRYKNAPQSQRVKITSYEAVAHTTRRVIADGVLGGTASACPAPTP